MDEFRKGAEINLSERLSGKYPGRGLVVGLDESGRNVIQIFWTMGSHEGSLKRILKEGQNGDVIVDVYGEKNPQTAYDLLLYRAMAESRGVFAVANGNHIISIINYAEISNSLLSLNLETPLTDWGCELDSPIFTPRIALMSNLWNEYSGYHQLSVIKRGSAWNTHNRALYTYRDLVPGIGHCITTYSGAEDERPTPYSGEPFNVPLIGGMRKIAESFWQKLDEEKRVAIAVKFINIRTRESIVHIKNRFE